MPNGSRTKGGRFVKRGGDGEKKSDNDLIVDLKDIEKDIENAEKTVEKSVEQTTRRLFGVDIGVHLLVAAFIAAVLVIFVIIPEFSHKPTEPVTIDTLGPDDFVLVPNSCVKNNTKVDRLNRITGDRQRLKSQDRPQDDIVLATRDCVDGQIAFMTQGDAVPMHAELLDMAPWIPQRSARERAEQLGYLIVVV